MTIGDCAKADPESIGPESARARAAPIKSAWRFIVIVPNEVFGSIAEWSYGDIRIKVQTARRKCRVSHYCGAVEAAIGRCYASSGTKRLHEHEQSFVAQPS